MKCHFCTNLLKHTAGKLLLLLLPLVALRTSAQAPSLKFKHITNEQGLSNSTIECIFQDSRGFMWFGTRDGLNRFDGYQTTIYRYDAKDSNSISDNYIRAIYEDKQHFLWVATTNGLNRLDISSNRFTRYKHNPADAASISNNIVTALYEDASSRLWVCTAEGGLNLFSNTTGNFSRFRYQAGNAKSLSSDNTQCLLEDSKGRFWIGTANGLNLFDRTLQQVTGYYTLDNSSKSIENKIIRVICEDKKGDLWIGTEDNGIFVFNPRQKTFTQYQHREKDPLSLGSNQVRSIITDKEGNIWIGTVNGGLELFDATHQAFFHYKKETDDPESLSQRTVSALLEDKQGNLWIGTHRGGINLYTPGTDKFALYRQESKPNSLSYNDVRSFCEDNRGNIWIGTDGGGLNCFNRQTNKFTHYKYNPFDASGISSNEVLHVSEDSEGNIWIATWGGGLNLLDHHTGRFTRFTHDAANANSISSNYVQKVYEDRQHNLWVATYYGGLNLLDRKTRQFTSFIRDPQNRTALSGNNIVSLTEDNAGNLWIGTDDGGLNCYDPATQGFSHYFHTDDKMPDLRVLFCDSKGRLWVGQTGLYLFDPAKKAFNRFTTEAGLATEFIKGMTEDEKGNFWIATSNGLTCFNPDTHRFKKYNTGDGLQGLEFEANAYMKTRSGEMFFGGINGFNAFYPSSITSNSFVPPVYLTDLQVFNQKVIPGKNAPLQQDISVANTITLSHTQSSFSLGFAALNYTASENNQYAYKLDNWDHDWNLVGPERKASYTNLDPGTYTFHVKAANNDGVWNEQGATIRIVIRPPFWDTWWFKLLVILAAAGGIIAFYRFKQKLHLRKLEEQKREEMHQEQLQFFTNISHEFRTPLSLILGSLEKLQKETTGKLSVDYYKIMQRNIHRMTGLINELMDFRKVETGILELKVMPGNISLFTEEIAEEFCELAAQKQINFTVEVPDNLPEYWFDRLVLEKIVLNLLSNSFKYTADGGRVAIQLFTDLNHFTPSFSNELLLPNEYKGKQYAYIRVADNGIGISGDSIRHLFERYYKISDSHLGSGIGLAFVKSLTALHKGHIYVYSERNKGTEIIIGIPVHKEDYKPAERWVHNNEPVMRLESIHYRDEQPALTTDEHTHDINNTANGKYHILLADDNDELRQFIKDSLQPVYHVTEATDGYSGLIKAREEFPDLIISDVMMPGMNGIDFCKQVKEHIDTSHIPFMMLTAKDAPAARLEGVDSGADFYFAKPISIDLLQLTIRNIFDQRRILKERYSKDHYAATKEQVHSTKDKLFMDDLLAIIEAQLTNPDMDVDYICSKIGMSRTRLYEKIKGITGQSIGELVRTIRLRKAIQIMTHEDVPLTEVMYRVGIQTQSYFTKAFKKEFGKTPTQFLQELKK
ncbi:MAG: two-component regulator propeller domain-containing protein [Chitinophagaceae bacterium]